ncbi:helix-turn-helix domain-containing protein [Marinospirillum minutulum]|uniref:helix-turn-helix domain-containing protein n=1 Tax=Marinospirillum minutulum TaxID=64974 RepID=UPI0003FB1328|nr:helix-turn-helix domain-containing protein [Marinospirillum minutulum]
MEQALTVKQVAELLNVNERTIYRMAASGKIPGFKVADSWRFLPKDIQNWIEDQKAQSATRVDSQ